MTRQQMIELARGNVDAHLGADFEEGVDPTPDMIYDDAYTLAIDKLLDSGVDRDEASSVAQEVAQSYAPAVKLVVDTTVESW